MLAEGIPAAFRQAIGLVETLSDVGTGFSPLVAVPTIHRPSFRTPSSTSSTRDNFFGGDCFANSAVLAVQTSLTLISPLITPNALGRLGNKGTAFYKMWMGGFRARFHCTACPSTLITKNDSRCLPNTRAGIRFRK